MGIVEEAEYFVYLTELATKENICHCRYKTIHSGIHDLQAEFDIRDIEYHKKHEFINKMIEELV